MLNTAKLRTLYSKIQNQLFNLIPEKWDRIYLYASMCENRNHLETGEMFFYYFPKGLLKKNPVNVYEVPSKFNVDENAYMELVDKLYQTIKLLKMEFERAEEKMWTNLTISIENLKFHVEYDYEDLASSRYSSYDRHIIWKYKYLDVPIERLQKRDREMLERYLLEENFQDKDIKEYSEGVYKNNVHNIIDYDKEERIEQGYIEEKEEEKLDKYELYKRKKEEQRRKEMGIEIEEKKKKNQILNF